jgi:hypothetical protein
LLHQLAKPWSDQVAVSPVRLARLEVGSWRLARVPQVSPWAKFSNGKPWFEHRRRLPISPAVSHVPRLRRLRRRADAHLPPITSHHLALPAFPA